MEKLRTLIVRLFLFSRLPRFPCSYFNVSLVAGGNAGQRKTTIRSKDVVPAMSAVLQQSREIRVFNLSIDADTDLAAMDEQQRRNTLNLVEDLDMFAFENDVLVIVAAGNSLPGVPPEPQYPHHWSDERWQLRSWSRAFNALTCGGITPRICLNGLTRRANAPSPFCRNGPGFADSPKPDLCATAGDCGANYNPTREGGVLALDEAGYLSETIGTSFAAPLLAREAALTFDFLQHNHRPEGGRVFAATVKAFLAATAEPVELPAAFSKLERFNKSYSHTKQTSPSHLGLILSLTRSRLRKLVHLRFGPGPCAVVI